MNTNNIALELRILALNNSVTPKTDLIQKKQNHNIFKEKGQVQETETRSKKSK